METDTVPRNVVVVGSVNQDVLLAVPAFPLSGETVLATGSRTATGGKGANQAVAAAHAGAVTRFIGAFGADTAAEELHAALTDEGVLLDSALWSTRPSGRAIVLVDADGSNCIVVDQGANADLQPGHVADVASRLSPGDVLVVQCELPSDTIVSALRAGAAAGAVVLLNLAPYQPIAADDLRHVSLLVVNEVEAAELIGTPGMLGDPAGAALRLASAYDCACVITLGEQGSVTVADGAAAWIPAEPVDRVVDTTGAGDAFVGVLAARLAQHDPLSAAVRAATLAAARTVQALGAQTASIADDLAQPAELGHVGG